MIKKKNKIAVLLILIIIYFLLKYYIPYWWYIIYPINLLVTFLHEFWHAFFALITWWSVLWLVVNSDWSWVTTTSWGVRDLVVSWWYLGSALFGNILLYIWIKKQKYSEKILYFLSLLMVFVSIFWFNWIASSLIILALASWIFILARYSKYDSLILQFLGVSSILFIIEDFNVWPSSDLAHFSGILPVSVWMVVWLIIVVLISLYNLKLILKK